MSMDHDWWLLVSSYVAGTRGAKRVPSRSVRAGLVSTLVALVVPVLAPGLHAGGPRRRVYAACRSSL